MAKYRGFNAAPTFNASSIGDVQEIDASIQSDLRQRGGDNKLFLDSQADFNRRGSFSIRFLNANSALMPGSSGALVWVLKDDAATPGTITNTISNCLINNRQERSPFDDFAEVTVSGGFVSSDGATNPWAIT